MYKHVLIHGLVRGRLRMQYLRCGWSMQAVRVRSWYSWTRGQTFSLWWWRSSQDSGTPRDRAICVHWSLACPMHNFSMADATLTLCNIYLWCLQKPVWEGGLKKCHKVESHPQPRAMELFSQCASKQKKRHMQGTEDSPYKRKMQMSNPLVHVFYKEL